MTTYREGYISENVSESFKLVYARSLQSIQVPVNSFSKSTFCTRRAGEPYAGNYYESKEADKPLEHAQV
jgi:hypothetical protein